MLRVALRELRHHPGRYLATLIAIAISVGFMAAASVVTSTEARAMGYQMGVPYSRADYVVRIAPDPATGAELPDDIAARVTAWLRAVPGVSLVWPLGQSGTLLENGDATSWAAVFAVPPSGLNWATVGPSGTPLSAVALGDDEVVITPGLARTLHAGIGTTVTVPAGASANPGALTLRVAGVTADATTRYDQNTVYVSQAVLEKDFGGGMAWEYLVKAGASVGPADLVSAAAGHSVPVKAVTGSAAADEARTNATQGVNVAKYLLWVFAAVALVVGMITIANTFTILLVQRRRQLGLLRAVGASGAQTRRSVWLEALAVGLVGAWLGIGLAYAVAAGVGAYTGSVHVGLSTPWRDLGLAVVLGVAITVLAAALPARRATRLPVLDALRPAEADVVGARRSSVVRAVVCGLLAVGGLALCVISLRGGGANVLALALGGAIATSLGVLFGAPLFVPTLLRGVSALVGRGGVTGATAAKNMTRDPARSSATATALMLAVGLIVTLQVGASTVQTTITDKIASSYPVGLWVAQMDWNVGIPPATRDKLAHAPGVTASVTLDCRTVMEQAPGQGMSFAACAYGPAILQVAPGAPASMPDDQVLVPPGDQRFMEGPTYADTATLAPYGADGMPTAAAVTLDVRASNLVRDMQVVLVSPATFARLDSPGSPVIQAVMLFATNDAIAAMRGVNDVIGDTGALMTGGSAVQREMIQQTMRILVDVVTGLLAVAVVIALVGVGNTLTLSVIERTRESALLRALGLKRGQLRLMLLLEALMLTLAAALVGAAFGVLFGFIGAHALAGQMTVDAQVNLVMHYSITWWQTLGLLGVLVVAAGLASVLPGRRAASASPVEALAEV